MDFITPETKMDNAKLLNHLFFSLKALLIVSILCPWIIYADAQDIKKL